MRAKQTQARRHGRTRRRGAALLAALVLGAGGIAAVAATASAGQDEWSRDEAGDARGGVVRTVDCPDVRDSVREVPRQSRTEVARSLSALDRQMSAAYRALGDGHETESVLRWLHDRRADTLGRMARDVTGRDGGPSDGAESMVRCEVRDGGESDPDTPPGGPSPEDFVDITTVEPNADEPEAEPDASTGSFTSECGRNDEEHFNSDNVIVSPGVVNAAQHVHDYVGNLATDAFSDNETLAAAETTCTNGDQSTYYWPVLRVLDGREDLRGRPEGAGDDGNVGTILQASGVSLTFEGSAVGDVVEMPRFLQIITGDAKAFTNGTDNANASWSCEGFEDRQLTDKYPLCPDGSDVVRTFRFQSCWDGQNIDSDNSRDHMAFALQDGSCPEGFVAVPQLVQRLTYDVPEAEALSQETPFAVDSFPDQLHKPVTDHSDFINAMPEELMREAVDCINDGRRCT